MLTAARQVSRVVVGSTNTVAGVSTMMVKRSTPFTGAAVRQVATAAKDRPLSPHLSIYKFRVNMITSVVFRGTGIAMVGGLGLLAIAYLPAGHKFHYYVYHLQQHRFFNALVKAGVTFPLVYHYLGGLRHLAWDNIVGHNMQWVKQTGWGAVAVASAAAALAMVVEVKPSRE